MVDFHLVKCLRSGGVLGIHIVRDVEMPDTHAVSAMRGYEAATG